MTSPDADEKVKRLILHLLRSRHEGFKSFWPPPDEHFRECPDVVVTEAEAHGEMWFDTGVEAVRLTARLSCPHRGEIEWEWADLGELPNLIEDMEADHSHDWQESFDAEGNHIGWQCAICKAITWPTAGTP